MVEINLLQLPIDILLVIFQKLSIQDIYNLILSCKTLNNLIVNNNAIWRYISRTRLIIHENKCDKNPSQVWYEKCRKSYNWCRGIYKNKGLIYHNTNYMPWLKLHKQEALLLTIGSDLHCYPIDEYGFPNGRQKQWKLGVPKIDRYDKRTNDISRFALHNNLLVCGNRNGSVTIHKMDDIKLPPKLVQHIKDCHEDGSVEVSDVDLINSKERSYLVTASTGSPIVHIWSWSTDDECTNLNGSSCYFDNYFDIDLGTDACSGVKCISLNKDGSNLAVGPDGNSKPVLIDLKVAEFLIRSDDSADVRQIVQDIQWHDENTLCYVTHSGILEMMDIRTHQVVYNTRDPFLAAFYCVKTDGNHAIVAGSSQHSRCVLYDSRKPQHTQIYFTQKNKKTSPVYSLHFDSNKLIAATDRSVTAMNFNIPSFMTTPRDYSDVFNS